MDINSQRHIRTGDKVKSKTDKQTRVVHYVIDQTNRMSFEEQFSKIKKILVYNGNEIETLFPNDLILT